MAIKNGNWLDVDADEPVPLAALAGCMTLCDLKRDSYFRLIAADISLEGQDVQATLKVFRGYHLKEEHKLPAIPAALESLYIDESEPKTPILAVAISESVLFYRHMKPYFKYTVPHLEPEELEQEIWRKLPVVRVENQNLLIENLKTIDRPKLSRKSQKLLLLPAEERDDFITRHAEVTLNRYPNVVAMRCLQRVSCDENPPSYLVLATDTGDILILEPQSFGMLYQARTCPHETTPSLMAVHGTYETDFCIVIATRFGGLYLLRKSAPHGQEILKLTHPVAGLTLLPIDQTIVVCTMDRRLTCYSKKGKQLFVVSLGEVPSCMTTIGLTHLGVTLVCVALQGGRVQLYLQRQLVDEFQVPSTVTALLWGRMGYEDCVLTLITEDGILLLKILRRLAIFEPHRVPKPKAISNLGPSTDVSLLDKPKKSSIFVEQTAREKQNAKETYGSFQAGLWRLRHTAARAMVEVLSTSESTISGDITHAPIKLSAELCGSGPTFRLYLTLQNLSTYKMASRLSVLMHADRRHYSIPKTYVAQLPSIFPGVPLKIDFEVTAILDPIDKLPPATLTPENAIIRVMLLKPNQSKPLIAAVIPMLTQ